MPIELFRIDDRLIHGQVVLGWGQPLDVGFIVVVDDAVAQSDWEQELYRMAVPPGMDVDFDSVEGFLRRATEYAARPKAGILLTGDVETMGRIVAGARAVQRVNVGGLHHRPGRLPRLRYVFLAPDEERALRAIAERGVNVTAQDLPSTTPVPLVDVLAGNGA